MTAPPMRPVTLVVEGARVEAAWWGEPRAAPVLVLLHEGLGSVGLWRDFPARLAAATGRAVFAFSRFGYGGSDPRPLPWPITYMHEEALEVLPRVLEAAGIGPHVLVGHSDGASIASIAAGRQGGADPQLAGLVLIAPHFFVEDMALEAIAAARVAYDEGDLRPRLARYHANPDIAFRGWNLSWLAPGFRAFDLRDEVARWSVPALILQGGADPYGTMAQPQFAERVARVPVRTRLLDEARHAPHLETPEPALAAILAFLAVGDEASGGKEVHYSA